MTSAARRASLTTHLVNSRIFGQIRLGAIEQTQAHLAVDGYGGKRLIDLVGNGSGQLAEH